LTAKYDRSIFSEKSINYDGVGCFIVKNFIIYLVRSSIGRKFIMGVTGIGLVSFILGHLAGNLFIYVNKGAGLTAYAHHLHSIPGLIFIETALGILFFIHIFFGIWLTYENWRARPIKYIKNAWAGGRTIASATMIYTGLTILAFILYHLYGMKFGPVSGKEAFPKVSSILVQFKGMIIYIIGVLALGTHMFHGIKSVFQSLGLRHPKYDNIPDTLGPVLAVLICVAFASIPLTLYFMRGVIK
jgi:succinate dehydrogenase / fumarate reductase cytochrome b subunit